ncbi:MAG: hypothetical protein K0S08_201 [Gammaproteobacteria bacterium]|jgi:hypothetical protein|nr:hypothetical protein [Gammaproteobacteria bacterium]
MPKNNHAVQYFMGQTTPQSQDLRQTEVSYDEKAIIYLSHVQSNEFLPAWLRIYLGEASESLLLTAMAQLQILRHQLNASGLYIAKMPDVGQHAHYILLVLHQSQLLVVHPLGLVNTPAFYQVLQKIQKACRLENIYLSTNVLQNSADLAASGPLLVEVLRSFAKLPPAQLFASLQMQAPFCQEELTLTKVDLSDCLPAAFIQSIAAPDGVAQLRLAHLNMLENPIHNGQIHTVEEQDEYLQEKCLKAGEQVLFHRLITEPGFTCMQLSPDDCYYSALKQRLSQPLSLVSRKASEARLCRADTFFDRAVTDRTTAIMMRMVSRLKLNWTIISKFKVDPSDPDARWLVDFLKQYPPIAAFLHELESKGFGFEGAMAQPFVASNEFEKPHILFFDQPLIIGKIPRRSLADVKTELGKIETKLNQLLRARKTTLLSPTVASGTKSPVPPQTPPLASKQTGDVSSPFASPAFTNTEQKTTVALLESMRAAAEKVRVLRQHKEVMSRKYVKKFVPEEGESFNHLHEDKEGNVYFYYFDSDEVEGQFLRIAVEIVRVYQALLENYENYGDNEPIHLFFVRLFCALTETHGGVGRYSHFFSGGLLDEGIKAILNLCISFVNFGEYIVFLEALQNDYQYHGDGVFTRRGVTLSDRLEGTLTDKRMGLRGTKPGDKPNSIYWLAEELLDQEERKIIEVNLPDDFAALAEIYHLQLAHAKLLQKTEESFEDLTGGDRKQIAESSANIQEKIQAFLLRYPKLALPKTQQEFEKVFRTLHPHRAMLLQERASLPEKMTAQQYRELIERLSIKREYLALAKDNELVAREIAVESFHDAALIARVSCEPLKEIHQLEVATGQNISDNIELIRQENIKLTDNIHQTALTLDKEIDRILQDLAPLEAQYNNTSFSQELQQEKIAIAELSLEANENLAHRRLSAIYDELLAKQKRALLIDKQKELLGHPTAIAIHGLGEELSDKLLQLKEIAQKLDQYQPDESGKKFVTCVDDLLAENAAILEKMNALISVPKSDLQASLDELLTKMKVLKNDQVPRLESVLNEQQKKMQARYTDSNRSMKAKQREITQALQQIKLIVAAVRNEQIQNAMQKTYENFCELLGRLFKRLELFESSRLKKDWFKKVDDLEKEGGYQTSDLPIDLEKLAANTKKFLSVLSPHALAHKKQQLRHLAFQKHHYAAYAGFLEKFSPIKNEYFYAPETKLLRRIRDVRHNHKRFSELVPEQQLLELKDIIFRLMTLQDNLHHIADLKQTLNLSVVGFSMFELPRLHQWLVYTDPRAFSAKYQAVFKCLAKIDEATKDASVMMSDAEMQEKNRQLDSLFAEFNLLVKPEEKPLQNADEAQVITYIEWFEKNIKHKLAGLTKKCNELEIKLGKYQPKRTLAEILAQPFDEIDLDELQMLMRGTPKQSFDEDAMTSFLSKLRRKIPTANDQWLEKAFEILSCFGRGNNFPETLKNLFGVTLFELAERFLQRGNTIKRELIIDESVPEQAQSCYAVASILYPRVAIFGGVPPKILAERFRYTLEASVLAKVRQTLTKYTATFTIGEFIPPSCSETGVTTGEMLYTEIETRAFVRDNPSLMRKFSAAWSETLARFYCHSPEEIEETVVLSLQKARKKDDLRITHATLCAFFSGNARETARVARLEEMIQLRSQIPSLH